MNGLRSPDPAKTAAIRATTRADTDSAAGTLADAFANDPAFDWIVKNDQNRAKRIKRAFVHQLEVFGPFGISSLAYDTQGCVLGSALWARHDQWKPSPVAFARSLPVAVRVSGLRGLPRIAEAMASVEEHHPPDPHYYLSIIGVHPAHQGKGVAAALFEPMLARCDHEMMPAYLEATTIPNAQYYQRFGFTETKQFQFGRGGPPLVGMWREPLRRYRVTR